MFSHQIFRGTNPTSLRENEVSAILDATGGRVDGSAGDVWFHLQAKWEESMQAELVSFRIDLFDLEDEVQGAANGFSSEVDGLAYASWAFWFTLFYLYIG